MKFLIGSIILLLFIVCSGDESIQTKPENILFIGNSYTYRNGGIDKHLSYLLGGTLKRDDELIHRAAKGKYHLHMHWKDPETKLLFKSKKWDKIVLQEFSTGPLRETSKFHSSAKKWAKEIRKVNKDAEIYLYSTWNYKNTPGMEDSVLTQYQKVSTKIDAKVVLVGMLWKKLRAKINLYDGDGAHPNRKGTFVTACLFYEELFGLDVTKTRHTDPMLSIAEQRKLKRWAHEFHLLAQK